MVCQVKTTVSKAVWTPPKVPAFSGNMLVIWILILFCIQAKAQVRNEESDAPEKAFVSFRVGLGQSLSENRFRELLDLFDKYKGVTDEITLFSSITHPPIPLNVFQARMQIFKKRMQEARSRGYRTGINILSTIGHHNENVDYSLKGKYTLLTGIDGKVAEGTYCPNDSEFKKYIVEIYKALALADPDYIWLDDDIRLAGHSPLNQTCFCDHCMKRFNQHSGTSYSREDLRNKFNQGSPEEKLPLRNAWIQNNNRTISDLFTLIEKTVHDLRPNMPLGFMTGDRFYEGYDFDNWAKILSGKNNVPVYWRPGGGFYNDNVPSDASDKAHAIGRQVSLLPGNMNSIQSEIENFPYQRFKKSAHIVALEAASYIAAGCTGAAFNVLSFYDEPLTEYERLLGKLQKTRPFLDLMVRKLGRSPIEGVSSVWNKNAYASLNSLADENWFAGGNPVVRQEFYEVGIPASYDYKNAAVSLLEKDAVRVLSKEEIMQLLSKSVYMTAEALEQLNQMGYAHLTGFKVIATNNSDRIERLTAHTMNAPYAGRLRDNRQSFWKMPAYTLQKTSKNAQLLSELVDYDDKIVGECTMGIFENELGGRICISGYYPWTFMGSQSKATQMKSVFRWLSKDTLPGYIASFHKINIWIRKTRNEATALSLSNSSFDTAENVELALLTGKSKIKIYDMNGSEQRVQSSGSDGSYAKFIIPKIDPWNILLVEAY